jgi:phospholipid/cholesterol/gamma-HCH transport system permease protein
MTPYEENRVSTSALSVEHADDGTRVMLSGTWTLARIQDIDKQLVATDLPAATLTLDGASLETLDTAAGLALLARIASAGASIGRMVNVKPNHSSVIETVRAQMRIAERVPSRSRRGLVGGLGAAAERFAHLLLEHLDFLGRCVAALGELVADPRRTRWKELAAQLQHVCIEAIPVVALVTLLIGMVLAYLFGMQADKYGAGIFVVDAVAIGTSRELAPILVAVIVAGRSGAAFTAQLGTMRLTEEIDALRTLALSPMQVLVIPRLIALVISLPLLVFVGDVAALAGAMFVAQPVLDITPANFIGRVHSQLPIQHVIVGLAKGSIFGLAIALIGCRAGMNVERDARSIGLSTTSTVVQCIVAVILLDAFIAVWLQSIGL